MVISLDDPSDYSSKVEPVLHIPISHEKKTWAFRIVMENDPFRSMVYLLSWWLSFN
jgi:hypothetical protein